MLYEYFRNLVELSKLLSRGGMESYFSVSSISKAFLKSRKRDIVISIANPFSVLSGELNTAFPARHFSNFCTHSSVDVNSNFLMGATYLKSVYG